MNTPASVDLYIRVFPEGVQEILQQMRRAVVEEIPEATETISYGIPTYKLYGKNLVHFGGFKDHVSFFPGAEAVEVFAKEISSYETSKGTIQFPFDAVPYSLIKKITRYRVKKMTNETKNV